MLTQYWLKLVPGKNLIDTELSGLFGNVNIGVTMGECNRYLFHERIRSDIFIKAAKEEPSNCSPFNEPCIVEVHTVCSA